jgi:hypothetical protein
LRLRRAGFVERLAELRACRRDVIPEGLSRLRGGLFDLARQNADGVRLQFFGGVDKFGECRPELASERSPVSCSMSSLTVTSAKMGSSGSTLM